MSKIALKITSLTSGELKALLRKDQQYKHSIRLHACYQVSLGKRPKELAEIYGTSLKSICNWVNKLNSGGIEALVDKDKVGRSSRLSIEQKKNIKKVVLSNTPADFGYNSATWTGLLLIDWIKKQYDITYKKAQIYNILKSLGLSFQKGKGIYPEAAQREEAVIALKKTSNGAGK